jgi:predicted helicase
LPDLHFNGDSQCFPRWIYKDDQEQVDLFQAKTENRIDALSPESIEHFRWTYPGETVTSEDVFYYIYGILHSEDYRLAYANNLSKELPRIPRVATYHDFISFSNAGRKLADLHVNYESAPKYDKLTIQMRPGASFKVTQLRYGKIPGKTGNAAKDKSRIIFNNDISIENIPLDAQAYVINKRSALDWLVERCGVSVDKESGIVNDFNLYGEENDNPHYIFDLIPRIITVSLETMKIVKALPKLTIHPLDK